MFRTRAWRQKNCWIATTSPAAIKLLEAALHKHPAEPNLEALLALARTESDRQFQDQESQAAKEASERALLQIQAAQRQAARCEMRWLSGTISTIWKILPLS